MPISSRSMRPKQQQQQQPRSLTRRMAFSPTLFWWATTTVAMAITTAMTEKPFGGFVATAWIHSSPVLSPFRDCTGGSFCAADWVVVSKKGRSRFPTTTVALASSYGQDNGSGGNNNSNNNSNTDQTTPEYRSIADVVGGLHGGKYQFGGVGGGVFSDDAFSGHGGNDLQAEQQEPDEDDLPNWAKKMAPKPSSPTDAAAAPLLRVPSNSNPMDGMVYFASIDISNQERTWEKFYAKLLQGSGGEPGRLERVDSETTGLKVAPTSGVLAPRGGASNACDASQPYSDTATIRVTQQSPDKRSASPSGAINNGGEDATDNADLWLVVGTEEEQWTYKLDLLED